MIVHVLAVECKKFRECLLREFGIRSDLFADHIDGRSETSAREALVKYVLAGFLDASACRQLSRSSHTIPRVVGVFT
jgi:hypothetical protein